MKQVVPTPGMLLDYQLLAYEELDSTNEEARRLAKSGAEHGTVIWAKRQNAGKGRAGRAWVSEAGNLYVSVLVRPVCALEAMGQLSYVAAMAAYDTIAGVLPDADHVALKWPNDVLAGGHKISGILLESFTIPERGRWAVVGVGINVDNYPLETNFPASCLREQGVELISAKIVLSRFIHHFITRYNQWNKKGFGSIRRDWLEAAWGIGQPVRVSLPHEELHGTFKGIDKDGAFILETAPRKKTLVHAGDVVWLEPEVEPTQLTPWLHEE